MDPKRKRGSGEGLMEYEAQMDTTGGITIAQPGSDLNGLNWSKNVIGAGTRNQTRLGL